MAQKRLAGGEMCLSAEEGQLAGVEQRQQAGEEQPAEQGAQHTHRQQERGAR